MTPLGGGGSTPAHTLSGQCCLLHVVGCRLRVSRAYTNYVLQQRIPMQDSLVFNSLLVMQWGDLNCGEPYMYSAILFRKAKTREHETKSFVGETLHKSLLAGFNRTLVQI